MLKIIFAILLWVSGLFAQTITHAEYFFDFDPGFGNGTALTVASDDTIPLVTGISVASLASGLHSLYLRYLDSDGNWGAPDGHFFFVVNYGGRTVTQAECFYDNDPGIGNGTSIAISSGNITNLAVPIAASGLTVGLHRLYLRFRDNSGRWGEPDGHFFFVVNYGGRTETQAEYFYDNDPGNGSGTSLTITPGSTTMLAVAVPANALSLGLHRFYIRYRDNSNKWGTTDGHFFVVTGDGLGIVSYLAGAEYFINWDPGYGNGISLPAEDGTWNQMNESINTLIAGIPSGRHWIGLRYRDNLGLWSNTLYDTFFVTQPLTIQPEGSPPVASVRLRWTSQTGSEFYIFRANSSDGPFAYLDSTSNNTYVDVGTVNARPAAYYQITQGGTGGFSDFRRPPMP